MTVVPDGEGRIELEVRFGEQLSGGIRDEVARGADLTRVSRGRVGGNWRGIAFWSDEKTEVQDGRVLYRGSAWFRDLNALDFSGRPCRWTRREEDGGFDLEFYFDPLPARQEGQSRAEQAEQLREILEGFAVELTMRLPGMVREVEGNGEFLDRQAIYRLSAADLFEGARLEEEERARRFHRFRVKGDPPLPEAEKEAAAFEEEWRAKEAVGVRHASGVSLGGPTAATAFALEEETAAAGATVVAGAGAYTAARDGEPAGFALEGAGDLRLATNAEQWREAALLDPAMILPLMRPRPLAVVGGEDDGLAPGAALRRLARAAEGWPEVYLRVHPGVGHFLTAEQADEVSAWIVETALRIREGT